LLVDNLAEANGARVIHTSSLAYKFVGYGGILNFDDLVREGKDYQTFHAYNVSKLMQILYAYECQRVWGESKNISSFSFHPGVVTSQLGWNTAVGKFARPLMKPFEQTEDQGASTALYCALTDEALEHAGHYFSDCNYEQLSPKVLDADKARQVRELTLRMLEK
jgi:NAD(P)-dependent dehydrogenase (short-subunit alcohol dehydrogenase family)